MSDVEEHWARFGCSGDTCCGCATHPVGPFNGPERADWIVHLTRDHGNTVERVEALTAVSRD